MLLLLKKLSLSGDIAAVTLRKNVFAERLYCAPGDHPAPNRSLNWDFELMPIDKLFHLLHDSLPVVEGELSVDNHTQSINRLLVDLDVELDEVALLIAVELVVE